MVQTNSLRKKLIVITGPTAIGKSDLAVDLAQKNNGEIISSDSMQIYKGMDIGTGKVTECEKEGIEHYLLDIVFPDEAYSVGRYVDDAEKCLQNIYNRQKTPIMVGGTGLYISALLNGSDFGKADTNLEIRDKWKTIAQQNGKEYVHQKLREIDPESADKINVNDVKRTIRALEIYEITGVPKSKIVHSTACPYDALVIVLTCENREILYDRINRRVDKMFDAGLIDEVKSLIKYRNCQSMQAIGYKEVVEYLDGNITLDESKELVKKNSRNYAKRQMTFFRGMNANKIFMSFDRPDEIEKTVIKFLEE